MDYFYRKKDLLSNEVTSWEWLDTNGLGGYSSSTISGINTRKYHALLAAPLKNRSDGRYILLNKVEDSLIVNENERILTSHHFSEKVCKNSLDNLQDFYIHNNHPIWVFKFEKLVLQKEIMMISEENTVLLKYIISEVDNEYDLTIRPLFSMRNFHKTQYENPAVTNQIIHIKDGFEYIQYEGIPGIFIQINVDHKINSDPMWYRNFIYTREMLRGYHCTEDLFTPALIGLKLKPNQEVIISCSLKKQEVALSEKWETETFLRTEKARKLSGNTFQKKLHLAGERFLVKHENEDYPSIIAGYHWFSEWGRDAMISLPGLTLYEGKKQEELGLSILRRFALSEQQGVIPNIFINDGSGHAYNSVDASLWFVWALQQYYIKTNNLEQIMTNFWLTLKNIYSHYRYGTIYDIKMSDSGLIYAGNGNTNLTWMDAVIDGKPVIPRYGYPVEVNSLWYNMIGFMKELSELTRDPLYLELQQLLTLIKNSFVKVFWNEDCGYLYDYVNEEHQSLSIRPNQIFAVSLPYSPLTIEMASKVVAVVREHLLTPYGLRTLFPGSVDYRGLYTGSQQSRDKSYHNGTIWPWLLGHFTEALIKVTADRKKVLAIIAPSLEALEAHLGEYGLGGIAEIFSGNSPHNPDGCISQAWSIAEILRLTYLLERHE